MISRAINKLFIPSRHREPIIKGIVSPRLSVPPSIIPPEYHQTTQPATRPEEIYCYHPDDHPALRRSARLAREILELCLKLAQPGVTTDEIDRLAHVEMIRRGAYPSPLNYMGFPKSICSSVNEVVCHGIPDNQILRSGDLVSIDVSLYLDGFHGDNCGSVVVPGESKEVDRERSQRLVDATREAVEKAVLTCKPGSCLTEVGKTIQSVADKRGYGIVHEFCGHGTGVFLHMLPFVLHYANEEKLVLEPGMVFTVEPIFTEGKRDIFFWPDQWTAATKDRGWSAQIEHEILITEAGAEILTDI